jgi:hypothetical protein
MVSAALPSGPRRLCVQRSAEAPSSLRAFRVAVLACSLGLSLACGSKSATSPPAVAPGAEPATAAPPPRKRDMAARAEIGGLNEREAEQSFRDSIDGLQACMERAVQRLDFIGGNIEFAVQVDSSRHPTRVWAAQSSLGERETEKCMFDVLRTVSWPAPQGGAVGIARNSFDFEPHKGSVAPAVWDAARVSGVLARLDDKLTECRGDASSPLLITLYIGEGGKALSGGAASAEPVDDESVDCVVDTLLAAHYPAPERTPTKVRFQL